MADKPKSRAGRPKGGGISKKSVKDAKLLLARYQGGDPLKWLLKVIQGDITEYQGQKLNVDHLIRCVELAMPYLYAKLQKVEIDGKIEHTQVEGIEEYVLRVKNNRPSTIEVIEDNQEDLNETEVEYKKIVTR